ncbi:T9SS type B sorting domain-containing protein [Neolewinella aurantiaca]|uniref:T9SS type B sorting domain-containing protein n=1 Tax=Neolewinella aurantiaca TaxID=2602767 RepID=A0A5C7FJV3_9BACT|nr:PKD domain-containing protein [Neolewinella aurantiaca]TXF91618.1 T9SS type B sorting domain-containing protein [Neolewinella aurantiaca]
MSFPKLSPKGLLLLLALTFVPFSEVLADHIVGGEFTYSCQGWLNDDPSTGIKVYACQINMYRDCIGDGAYFDGVALTTSTGPDGFSSSPMHISIYRGNNTTPYEATRSLLLGPVADVPINLGNPCLEFNEEVCQQIGVYDFEIQLPVSDESYTLTYQRCCRNMTILNLLNPSEIGSTYFIEITPEAQQRCNESPKFNINPPIALCANADFQIDLGATEREGDSLVYKFCDPIVGGGQDGSMQTPSSFDDVVPLVESPPPYTSAGFRMPQFNVNNQLGVGSTLNLDPETGLMSGNPIFRGTFSLAICVEEWSRDSVPVLLSETKREFQMTVDLCGNQVFADLLETEIDDQGRFFIRQCGPGQNTIINESTVERFITEYNWELDGPEGLITGSNRDFSSTINEVGVYEGTMILNRSSIADNCRDTAFFLLGVFPDTEPDFEFTVPGCDDEPIDFTDLSVPLGDNTIVNWSWDFADNSNEDTRQNPRHRYSIPGSFDVTLTTTDNNGCTAIATNNLDYFPSPRTILIEPDEGFGCVPFTKDFINLSQPINDDYIFEWEFGDGGMADIASPTYVYENSGVYDVYLGITSPTGCFVDTTFVSLVDVRDAPEADFIWTPDEPTNILPDIRVLDQSVGANQRRYVLRNAAGDQLFTTPAQDFDYTLRDTGQVFITQFVTHPSGCVDTITKDLRLRLINTYFLPDVFTPNGDGLNDAFVPVGLLNGVTNYRLRVWTRWGELVFSTNVIKDGWDGTFNGRESPGGAYLWDVQYTDVNGDAEALKGGVVLVR